MALLLRHLLALLLRHILAVGVRNLEETKRDSRIKDMSVSYNCYIEHLFT